MGPRQFAASLDMYRKVPNDLLEGTRRGSALSILSVVTMITLIVLETRAFLRSYWTTQLALDSNDEKRIRINFNISMLDMSCEYAVIDVVSALGTDQNVTAHTSRWSVDPEGIKQRYLGRNLRQHDIDLMDEAVTESIEELHEDGEDAISLDPRTFEFARRGNDFLFVDFYASWCSHCRDLAPTWETLAEVMDMAAHEATEEEKKKHRHRWNDEEFNAAKEVNKPVMISKVDCVLFPDVCKDQGIKAYPSLRLFVNGEFKEAYKGHRTVMDLVHWLGQKENDYKEATGDGVNMALATAKAKERMEVSEPEKQWTEKMKLRHSKAIRKVDWVDEDHPGCQIAGYLWLDRAPGNFHIKARSSNQDLVPHMTNVSHIVHNLTIGEPIAVAMIHKGLAAIPDEAFDKLSPMDGNVYVTRGLHEAYHHYLKLVTMDTKELSSRAKRPVKAYQVLHSSQLAYYRNDVVPEAKFIYDLSPIAVSYEQESRHWYDFATSLLAIVGGTFTIFGMLEGAFQATVRRRRYNY